MTHTDNLYVTVTDTSTNKVYCPKGYEILEANTYSTKTIVTSGTSDADKWGILDQANKEIKLHLTLLPELVTVKLSGNMLLPILYLLN